jgi:hypothetical protein
VNIAHKEDKALLLLNLHQQDVAIPRPTPIAMANMGGVKPESCFACVFEKI